MTTFILRLTDRGVVVVKIVVLIMIFIILAYVSDKIVSLDKVEIVKPLEEIQYVNKVWDSEEYYYIFKDNEGHNRWYRLITIGDSISFVSYYPAIIECDDDLLIRVRWDPNKHVDCETFLRMARKYNGIAGKGEVGFCKKYHLPTNKIKTVCGEF